MSNCLGRTEEGRIDYGVEWLKCRVKQVLLDQLQQKCYSDVRDSPKIKTDLKIANYLKNLLHNVSRTLCKYRTCNHNLPIEKGKYIGLERGTICDFVRYVI